MILARHSAFLQSLLCCVAVGWLAFGPGLGSVWAQYDREHLERILAPLEILPSVQESGKQESGASAATPPDSTNSTESANEGVLSSTELLSALHAQIARHFDVQGDLLLAFAREWRPVKLAEGKYAIEITEYPDQLKSVFSVKCRVTADGRVVGEWPIPLRAQLIREVWVANDRLPRGTIIDRNMLGVRKVDVLRDGEGWLPTSVDLTNLEVAEGVAAGKGFTRKDIVSQPLIRKNQIVEVTARKGAMTITMKAQALENGGLHDLIRVRNLESRKEFNAQVIDAHRVQVFF